MILTASNECLNKPCGELCSVGICNGNGRCVDVIENPCEVQGCEGKKCGEDCLSGDILGVCDASGICESNINAVQCQSNFNLIDIILFDSRL